MYVPEIESLPPCSSPQLISYLSTHFPPVDTSPISCALRSGSMAAAIGQMSQHELSSSIVLALLELCVARNPGDFTGGRGYMLYFDVYTG